MTISPFGENEGTDWSKYGYIKEPRQRPTPTEPLEVACLEELRLLVLNNLITSKVANHVAKRLENYVLSDPNTSLTHIRARSIIRTVVKEVFLRQLAIYSIEQTKTNDKPEKATIDAVSTMQMFGLSILTKLKKLSLISDDIFTETKTYIESWKSTPNTTDIKIIKRWAANYIFNSIKHAMYNRHQESVDKRVAEIESSINGFMADKEMIATKNPDTVSSTSNLLTMSKDEVFDKLTSHLNKMLVNKSKIKTKALLKDWYVLWDIIYEQACLLCKYCNHPQPDYYLVTIPTRFLNTYIEAGGSNGSVMPIYWRILDLTDMYLSNSSTALFENIQNKECREIIGHHVFNIYHTIILTKNHPILIQNMKQQSGNLGSIETLSNSEVFNEFFSKELRLLYEELISACTIDSNQKSENIERSNRIGDTNLLTLSKEELYERNTDYLENIFSRYSDDIKYHALLCWKLLFPTIYEQALLLCKYCDPPQPDYHLITIPHSFELSFIENTCFKNTPNTEINVCMPVYWRIMELTNTYLSNILKFDYLKNKECKRVVTEYVNSIYDFLTSKSILKNKINESTINLIKNDTIFEEFFHQELLQLCENVTTAAIQA